MTVKITLRGTATYADLPNEQRQHVMDQLALSNPAYIKMLRMGNAKAMWGMKSHIEYFTKLEGGDIRTGRGTIDPISAYLKVKGVPFEVEDKRKKVPMEQELETTVELRDYQVKAFKEINKPHGVIRLGCGFGKSIIALELARKLKQKTLIIVPRAHLLEQFKRDLFNLYGFEAGIIRSKQCDIKDITIATVQTLDKHKSRGTIHELNQFGCVIVDECHQFITEKRLKVMESFDAHYFYGMTATMERTDEQDKAVLFTFGPKLTDHDLPQAAPLVKVVASNVTIPVRDYHQIIEAQVESEDRNKMIIRLAQEQIDAGKKVIILTKRVDHIRRLMDLFENTDKVFPIYSDDNADEKAELFHKLRKNEIDYEAVLGTYSLLGTGTDAPSLDTIILAGDLKSHVLQKQSVGRILRLFEGKPQPLIIDIMDNLNPILKRQFNARNQVYNDNGWQVQLSN